MIAAVAQRVIAHADELTALDQAIGDGDHGINMKRGFEAVLAELDELAAKPTGEALKARRHDAGDEGRRRVRPALRQLVHGASARRSATAARPMARLPMSFAAGVDAVKARGKSDVGREDHARRAGAGAATCLRAGGPGSRRARCGRRPSAAPPRPSRCGRPGAAPRSWASGASATWIPAHARRR